MALPPHTLSDLLKLIMMEIAAVIVVRVAAKNMYGIDIFDFSKMPGKIFGGVITAVTFYGLYTTLSSGQKLQELGQKVTQ